MSESEPLSLVGQSVNQFFATFREAQENVSVDVVYGQPISHDDKLIVPIAGVSHFFGLGGGLGSAAKSEKTDEGGGGGGGGAVNARPIALAEISADGVKIIPIVDENRALAAGIAFAAWAVFWTARALIKIFK